jgi:HAD superfamily hydrolase (TIGR01509 family)
MLIIFDCDGVLIDSEIIACSVGAGIATSLGMPMTTHEFAARFTGIPYKDMWDTLERDLGTPVDPAVRLREKSEMLRRFAEELQPVAGIRELLNGIHGPKCVASSTGLAGLRKNLALVDLVAHFDPHIFSASQVARGKPAPDVFLHAAAQMGHDPSQCLVVEDSAAGVTAARRAHMRVVGFAGGGHADPALASRLMAAGALEVFSSPGALHHFLSREGLAHEAFV